MKRLVVLVALAACAKHPAITVAVGAGSISLLTCEANGASQQACGIITGSVVVFLGGLAWLVTALADTDAHMLPPDEELTPQGTVKLHTHTDLPPVPLDAGVPDAASPAAAPPDAAPAADAA
jgi:hypothetical protein